MTHIQGIWQGLTVNWFDRNSMLDEAAVYVDHQWYWNTIWPAHQLCNLEGYCTVGSSEFAFAVLVCMHLFQNFHQWANLQSKVLVAILIALTHVVTREMSLCDGSCHTLVKIDVDVFDLEVGWLDQVDASGSDQFVDCPLIVRSMLVKFHFSAAERSKCVLTSFGYESLASGMRPRSLSSVTGIASTCPWLRAWDSDQAVWQAMLRGRGSHVGFPCTAQPWKYRLAPVDQAIPSLLRRLDPGLDHPACPVGWDGAGHDADPESLQQRTKLQIYLTYTFNMTGIWLE